jgi:hypothetical protein
MTRSHRPVGRGGASVAVALSFALVLTGAAVASGAQRVEPAWRDLVAADAAGRDEPPVGATFKLIVRPGPLGFPGGAVPGQHCILLVAIRPVAEGWQGTAEVTATAPGASIRIRQARLSPGLVGEVIVVPKPFDGEEGSITVTVSARHGDEVQTVVRTITTYQDEGQPSEWAREILDRFLPWLADRFPELGIGPETTFHGSAARPHWLIVSHYLFLTPDWEVGVRWHVMIEPDDWAVLYLRHRWTDLRPSFAAEITSVQRGDTPHAITPTPELYR